MLDDTSPVFATACSNVHVEYPLTLLGGSSSSGEAITLSRRTIDHPTLIINSKDVTLRSILFKDAGGVVSRTELSSQGELMRARYSHLDC